MKLQTSAKEWVRFWDKVEKTPTCWNWTASQSSNGYGQFFLLQASGPIRAHRYAYMACVGEVPARKELHHRCRNKQCVNPNHLQVVSRRDHEDSAPSLARARTHCPGGHAYDEENTWFSKLGHRGCRACNRNRARLRKLKE